MLCIEFCRRRTPTMLLYNPYIRQHFEGNSLETLSIRMACVYDCSGFVRLVAFNIPDVIVLVFFVAFVIVFETSLDLHSAQTRPCVL